MVSGVSDCLSAVDRARKGGTTDQSGKSHETLFIASGALGRAGDSLCCAVEDTLAKQSKKGFVSTVFCQNTGTTARWVLLAVVGKGLLNRQSEGLDSFR